MSSKTRFRPRYIDAPSVEVGDSIRVAWLAGGIEHQRTGVVYRILEHHGALAFFTQEGAEIVHWTEQNRKRVKIVVLGRADNVSSLTELIGLDAI